MSLSRPESKKCSLLQSLSLFVLNHTRLGCLEYDIPHYYGSGLQAMGPGGHIALPEMGRLAKSSKHGICSFRVGAVPVYLLTEPQDIVNFAKIEKEKGLTKDPGTATLGEVLGNDILFHVSQSSPSWSKQNKTFHQNVSSKRALDDLYRGIQGIIQEHINQLTAIIENNPEIELSQFFTHLAMEVVSRLLLGSSSLYTRLDGADERRVDALSTAVSEAMKVITDPLTGFHFAANGRLKKISPRLDFPNPKKLDEAKTGLKNAFTVNLIGPDHQGMMSSSPLLTNLSSIDFREVKDSKEALMSDSAISNTKFVFIAGHETTSRLMNFALRMLFLRPDIVEKLKKEFREQGDPQDRTDLDNFHYLDHFINEILRLYPPFPLWTRYNESEDFDFPLASGKKLHVKAGTMFAISSWVTHRNEKFFPNPEKFDPDRWEKLGAEEKEELPEGSFIPFSLGKRKCPGAAMAILEAKLAIHMLIEHFDFQKLPQAFQDDNARVLETSIRGTMQATHEMQVQFKR